MIRDTSAQDVVIDPGPQKKRRLINAGIGIAALIIVLAIALPAYNRWASAEITVPLERLRIATVERSDFVRDVGVPGKVVAAVAPTLYSPAQGMVELQVKAGDTVEAGQVLAIIDSPEIISDLERAESLLESLTLAWERKKIETRAGELREKQAVDLAKVKLDAARREAARAALSFQEGIMSQQEKEKTDDTLATAEVEYQHAIENAALSKDSLDFELRTTRLDVDQQQMVVNNLQRRVDDLSITSPVTGMVGNVAVEQRASVPPNTPLLTVVDLTALEIEAQIPEIYADALGLGMPAEITYGTSTYDGILTAVSPEVQNAQVTARIRFADEAPGDLRQNQRVSARVVMETKEDIITVQRGPFVESGSGLMAYVIRGDLAVRTPIRIGSTSIRNVEIAEGLNPGDRIVISSYDQFESADTVYLTN
ncbi:MAG: efflux RND transporter periplasmic adaptor subunit [Gammaproteobacteria bacterium]|nr:efflux RND transporter periplasmic adaptor subunit [Gammaproteobacteria bacterium]